MSQPSHLRGCARRSPKQSRGRKRVADLLRSAVAEFAASGYEAATMQGIAQRARAPIGSLYQFFPNKQSVARALRARQIADCAELWVALREEPACRSLEAFVDRFTELMIGFVLGHPAFVPLVDGPPSTMPIGARDRLRKLLESMLVVLHKGLRRPARTRCAEVILNLNKTMMGMFGRATDRDRVWIAEHYRAVLRSYLDGQLAPRRRRAAAVGGH